MTGEHESGHHGVGRGVEEPGSSTRPAAGGEGPGPESDDRFDDEVVDAEIVDGEIVDGEVIGVDVDPATGGADRLEVEVELDPVAAALAQRDEYLDSLRRLQADFENYKKRVTKQQTDQVARAAVSLVEKVLPVLDTLDLATDHLGDPGSADGRALMAVASQLHDVLAKEGLERVDPVGEPFDPNAHEAVGQLPADDAADPARGGPDDAPATGTATPGEPVVGQVMRPGYRWRGTVVRPAMVMVRG
jgi:molecular chaperone GrpE